ncbi:MAG: class I SAM-dependent methyltransferase [Rhodocyclaceae bacterium]|nr:class I SAM-dependent methyltransferase [Rhodocyclaceae bacterium]
MIENTYGVVKRLEFITGVIAGCRPSRVLDVGCGTGANLTAPLARKFPDVRFVGIDSDAASITFANRKDCPDNARYYVEADTGDLGSFDLVIASEVIEHVEDPDAFLAFIKSCLTSKGRVVLTLPNGFGPFEFSSFAETIMHLTGVYRALWGIKRKLRGEATNTGPVDTLAVSPHINFFSYRQIRSVIAAAGFGVFEYRPRTFLCGFGFDQLMRSASVIAWNVEVADRLPPQMASAWMFLLEPSDIPCRSVYFRSAIARFRRLLNEKRWNLK